MGPLIPLFWTSGDVCPGFQSQGGFPRLRASSPVCNGFLRFTPAFSTNSGVHCISVYTAWLARWLFSHALGFEPPTQWSAAQWCVTKSDALPTELSRRHSMYLLRGVHAGGLSCEILLLCISHIAIFSCYYGFSFNLIAYRNIFEAGFEAEYLRFGVSAILPQTLICIYGNVCFSSESITRFFRQSNIIHRKCD